MKARQNLDGKKDKKKQGIFFNEKKLNVIAIVNTKALKGKEQ